MTIPNQSAIESRIYTIPEENWQQLQDKIDKLRRRGEKLGKDKPDIIVWAEINKPLILYKNGYGEVDYSAKPQQIEPELINEKDHLVTGYRRYYRIELVGTAPVVDGWKLVGVVEHTGDSEIGNIIRDVPGESMPLEYRNATAYCEHCNINRRRLETFVLRKTFETTEETATDLVSIGDKWIKVGRNCLADFIRDPNAADQICKWMEYLNDLASFCSDCEEDGFSGGCAIVRLSPMTALEFTARLIRLDGWMSRTKAKELMEKGEQPKSATANIVQSAFFNAAQFWKKSERDPKHNAWLDKLKETDPKDGELAAAALSWIKEKLPQKDELQDYMYNLLVVSSGDTIQEKHLGIFCSLISTYRREMGLLEQQKIRATQSNHVGIVDKRDVFVCTLVSSQPFDSDYGTKYLCRFDCDGNSLIWWSSTDAITDFNIGDKLEVKGTVKKHGEYKGWKQTELSRCKIRKIQ